MAGEKRQITRNRVSYSCQKCRQRKVKCDKVHPVCGACQKNGEECVYMTGEQENQPGQDAPTGNAKKRRQSLAESHREAAASGEALPASAGTTTSFDDQLSRLNTLLNQLSSVTGIDFIDRTKTAPSSAPSLIGVSPNDVLTPESQQSGQDSAAGPGASGTARNPNAPQRAEDGPENGVPTSNLNMISNQLEQLNSLLRTQQYDITKRAKHQHHTEQPAARPVMQSTPVEPESLFTVPTEQQRNVFFRCWLSSVYPILPIVDPAEVLIKYKALNFWYQYDLEKGVPNPAEEYVPLIFAIYYAGAMSMSVRAVRKWFPGTQRQRLLEMLRRQYTQSLQAPAKVIVNPPTLASRLIMCYMTSQSGEATTLTSTAAPIVRTAYSCNLHREKLNESLDPKAAEVRRRLWWETVSLDTLESIGSNMPPTINHHYCDTAIISELRNSKIGTPEAEQYEIMLRDGGAPDEADDPNSTQRSSMVSVIYMVMKVRTALGSNARRLLNINLAAKPKTREDMTEIRTALDETDRFLRYNIGRIPTKGVPELDFTPTTGKPGQSFAVDSGQMWAEDLMTNEIDFLCDLTSTNERWEMPYMHQYRQAMAAYHKWARIVLSMLLDQCHCFSYAPFMRSVKSKLWMQARQCALRHAHSCLRKYNSLATDLELERFRWAWVTMYQPIHACIIILIDTYLKPDSREAPRSRALLDQMLFLSSPGYGIIGGENGVTKVRPLQEAGNEAYSMLMQLRTKAWQKAGLDPNYLWTEEDQIQVGVATPLTEAEQLQQSIRESRDFQQPISDTGGQKTTASLLRPLFDQATKELRHPAQGEIPEEVDLTSNQSLLEGEDTSKRPPAQLHRAKGSQPRLHTVGSSQKSNTQGQSGYTYKFRPPSDLYDVNELIRKIREVQKTTKNGPGISSTGGSSVGHNNSTPNEDSAKLYRQIATANNDLTNFLAENFPDADPQQRLASKKKASKPAIPPSRSRNGNGSGSGSDTSDNAVFPMPPTPSATTAAQSPPRRPWHGSPSATGPDQQPSAFAPIAAERAPPPYEPSLSSPPTNPGSTPGSIANALSSAAASPLNHNNNNSSQPHALPTINGQMFVGDSPLTMNQRVPTPVPPADAQNPPTSLPQGGFSIGNTGAGAGADADTDVDMVNIDFDWERWDEVFGHLIDDSFQDMDISPGTFMGDMGMTGSGSGTGAGEKG